MAKVLLFKSKVKKDGQIIISSPEFGYTVVAVRDGERMVRFATAWCSPSDKFKRKIGKDVASYKFITGETMVAPLAALSDGSIIDYLSAAHDTLSHG